MTDLPTQTESTRHSAFLAPGAADAPTLEPGPVAEYLAHFPEREFRWNHRQQLWAVWGRDPDTGAEQFVEYVCNTLEESGDPPCLFEEDMFTGERRLVWVGATVDVRRRGRRVVYQHASKVYRPVDYPFVRRRLAEDVVRRDRGQDGVIAGVMQRNEARRRARIKPIAAAVAYLRVETARWAKRIASGGWQRR